MAWGVRWVCLAEPAGVHEDPEACASLDEAATVDCAGVHDVPLDRFWWCVEAAAVVAGAAVVVVAVAGAGWRIVMKNGIVMRKYTQWIGQGQGQGQGSRRRGGQQQHYWQTPPLHAEHR